MITVGVAILAMGLAKSPQTPSVHYSKRALLVGAWDYRSSKLPQLSGARDVELISRTLEQKFHWDAAHGGKIVMLTSRAETTRAKILSSFHEFLATDLQDGDTLYFHFSGHGYFAPDVDPGKHPYVKLMAPVNPVVGNQLDGLDPTLVPTDDPDHFANMIRGDEIGQMVQALKGSGKKLNIFLTFDSCHSQGAARGVGDDGMTVRGLPYEGPIIIPEPSEMTSPTSSLFQSLAHPSGYVAMSACEKEQSAVEALGSDGKKYGRFTIALVDAFNRCEPTTSYRELFQMVDSFVASHYTMGAAGRYSQNPVCEGNLDQVVFGQGGVPGSPYFPVKVIGQSGAGPAFYRLVAGLANGITDQSRIDLYGANSVIGTDKPFVSAVLGVPGLTETELTLPRALTQAERTKMVTAKAVLVAQGIEDVDPRIDVSAIASRPDSRAIVQRLKEDVPNAKVITERGKTANLKVVYFELRDRKNDPNEPKSSGYRIFRTGDEAELTIDPQGNSEPIPAGDSASGALTQRIFDEMRYEALCRLENSSPNQENYVEMRLVPCRTKHMVPATDPAYDLFIGPIPSKPAGTSISANLADFYAIQYRVHGRWEPYVALLDLTRDANPSQLWPDSEKTPDPIQIPPTSSGQPDGGWQYLMELDRKHVSVFKVTLPIGNEILKLVATEHPVEFSKILTRGSRGPGARGVQDPIGSLFDLYGNNAARSITNPHLSPSEVWSTREVKIAVAP